MNDEQERTVARSVERLGADGSSTRDEEVVVEEPLEIRIEREPLLVTMRTPGDDFDLVCGLLYTEGVFARMADIASIERCVSTDGGPSADGGEGTDPAHSNVVRVVPASGVVAHRAPAARVGHMTSACGVCGKNTIESVRVRVPRIDDDVRVGADVITALPDALRAEQRVFAATGGLHAVGLFDARGRLEVVREDVGRHNAADKVIGAMLRRGQVTGENIDRAGRLALTGRVLMFSGRAGFEIVQKAAVARVPVVCAVSAPSSLAVDLARDVGITLVGFVRGSAMNVYSHAERVRRLT